MSSYRSILEKGYPTELAKVVADAFDEIQTNFQARRWKASELDAGHFVEAVRRVIELELTGSFTPISKKLPGFSDSVLRQFERETGHESYRILIPRTLWAIYAIRNKRGVAHVGEVSPNELDATTISRMAKWVLGEIVRLKSGLSADETEALLHGIVQRDVPTLWLVDGRERILDRGLDAKDKVLVLLYARSPRTADELREAIEYTNKTRFKKLLGELHRAKLVDVGADKRVHLSPLGEAAAEGLLHD